MDPLILVVAFLALLIIIVLVKTAVVVPQQNAFVVERLGTYSGTLGAGFHVLTPFVDVIRYRHSLKEQTYDIPEQVCITRDNVQVGVDGVLYLKVLNPERASYGITDYRFAIVQLCQTTLRSEIGKIDLDKTFEERATINTQVVTEVDKASEAWGVKVLRYEIKNITPPQDILAAMEKQMRAEREKRAIVLTSEGVRDAAINKAEGEKQQVIKASEARKQQQINEAEGQGSAILTVATATGSGIRQVAEAILAPGGFEAVQLRVAEQYINQFGNLAKQGNTLIVPANLTDVASMIGAAMSVIRAGQPSGRIVRIGPRSRRNRRRWHRANALAVVPDRRQYVSAITNSFRRAPRPKYNCAGLTMATLLRRLLWQDDDGLFGGSTASKAPLRHRSDPSVFRASGFVAAGLVLAFRVHADSGVALRRTGSGGAAGVRTPLLAGAVRRLLRDDLGAGGGLGGRPGDVLRQHLARPGGVWLFTCDLEEAKVPGAFRGSRGDHRNRSAVAAGAGGTRHRSS